ncbi:thioredoxin fold domain-containing protein [Sphingobium sp. CFD-2]|jgi:thiol:disulfide interchange protein DsbC|uniref:thioredoxin fold domain-containing protein n=1 Tax=Sphingobium sp. CFD-2 TaxID=2878542 RepID=UPI00214D10BC|nr:thioredoxin fold domain-containing protein [Sphingobium sp. CFD-2]
MRVAKLGAVALVLPLILVAQSAASAQQADPLIAAAREAESELRQTFSNLQFEDFGPAPVKGPIYQASAGGRIIYYAPESEHLLFAAVYDRNGINITALAQDSTAQRKLAGIDTSKALALGPIGAPVVIEFTDPDCPYCRALDRFWAAKAAEGKPVRRLIFFVSGIHAEAAAKAEHILCSPDKEVAFKAIYAGAAPTALQSCAEGRSRVEADAKVVSKVGITGTPTLIVDGKVISGFQQAELEEFLKTGKALADAAR